MAPALPKGTERRNGGTAAPTWWEDVLASFTDAVLVTDGGDRVVLFNHAAEELVGIPRGRILGHPLTHAFPGVPLGDMVDRVRRTGHSESRVEEQLPIQGRMVPVRISCVPVWDRRVRSHIRGTTVVIHDMTTQRTLEEAARRNESLARLGTLVAGLAHEIRNPLAGIKGAAQLLRHRLTGAPELTEYTDVIAREADRLGALLEDLLTLGNPPQPKMRPLNIHAVLQHVASVLSEELHQRGFRLVCDFDPSLPDVLGDESRLSQLFLNLIKNAMDAGQETTTAPGDAAESITLRTRIETDFYILRGRERTSKYLSIDVADEGVGISPADQARIFEPFFTTKSRGTGLGLAISHRIVAEHGGIIRARPNQPQGTVVTVTLPVRKA